KEVPAENEIEVQNLVSQETHAGPVQQLSVENNYKGSRLEIATSVLNIETEPRMEELFHKGTFSMTLKDVNDETAQGNLHSDDPVLQLIDDQVKVSSNDDGDDILMVPAMQLISAKKREVKVSPTSLSEDSIAKWVEEAEKYFRVKKCVARRAVSSLSENPLFCYL
ncbi:hypothetical protein A2U01_0017266, partial [Trifolium medium]|nr:hypothetical protein [Trifolium medium]